MKISIEEIREFKKLQIIYELRVVEQRIYHLEQKYKQPFDLFTDHITNSKEEVFEEYDDYLEWKAYEYEKHKLEVDLLEVENAENFTIVS